MPQKPTHTAPLLGSQSAAYGYEHKYVGDSASHSVTPSHTMTKLGYMAYSSSASMDWYSRDSKIGYSYFGARYYNSDISVWLSACHPQLQRRRMDPLADKYPPLSPYMYTAGNPVMRIDPTGMLDDWVERDGKIVYNKDVTKAEDGKIRNLKAEDKYLGKEGYTINEENGKRGENFKRAWADCKRIYGR